MECYLDNSATTAVSPEAAALALHIMTEEYGNPSSLHRKGFAAQQRLEQARAQMAQVLHCRPEEIIFTAGGTESNNIALLGAARAMKRRGNRIVTTAVEHHSVLAICKALENEGFEVITVAPDESGHITPEAMAAACNEKTILASCMMVNSETGAIHDLPAIAAACRRKSPNLIFHADCVQSFCRLPIDPVKWGIQLVSVSGHKIHAPKGTGALYIAKGTRLLPPLYGSGQEKGLRPGTENTPYIVGLGLAAAKGAKNLSDRNAHIRALNAQLRTGLEELAQQAPITLNSPADAVPEVLNFSTNCVNSQTFIEYLSGRHIYVSGGSACDKGEPSHTLMAMGAPDLAVRTALRVSFCGDNTSEDVQALLDGLKDGLKELQHI